MHGCQRRHLHLRTPIVPPPATFLFVNAPKEHLEPVLRQHNLQPEQWGQWVSPYICVLVKTAEHRVLVDTGADGLAPSTGKLVQNLKAVGIAPEDIDTGIQTTSGGTLIVKAS